MAPDEQYDLFQMNDGPRAPAFDVVLRGYDRKQVEEELAGVQADLAAVTTDRDAAYAQASAYAAQIQRLQGEVYHLHQQMAALQTPAAAAAARVERMLKLAEAEAAGIRTKAEEALAAA